jgi:hypothetical protein
VQKAAAGQIQVRAPGARGDDEGGVVVGFFFQNG